MIVLAMASSASAQERVLVSGEVTCRDCRIVLDTVVTIGGLDGPGLHLISTASHVAVDVRGRILVGDRRLPEIAVFDADGEFLRIVGRAGEGPGEYQFISMTSPGPRFIHVFDYGGRTVLDHDFNVVRTDRFGGQVMAAVVTKSGDVIFNADVGTPDAIGHKFHVLGPAGEMESFGGSDSVHVGRSSYFFDLATGGVNTLWTVRMDANVMTRWELQPEPRVASVLVRDVEAFEKDRAANGRFPSSGNNGVMFDDSGLWVVWRAPDPAWTHRMVPGSDDGGLYDAPPQAWLDGWVDLLDPATGHTIARLQHDDHLRGFANGSRYIVAYRETEAGVPYMSLLNPRLVR